MHTIWTGDRLWRFARRRSRPQSAAKIMQHFSFTAISTTQNKRAKRQNAMLPVSIEFCLLKSQDFYSLNPSLALPDGFVVTQTDWGSSYTLDFYSVKETDHKEGRIEGVSAGYWQSRGDQWGLRSPDKIDFWVHSFDAKTKIHTVSFVHPEDSQQIDEAECGFTFGCSTELAIASIGNRDRQRKFKLRMEQLQGKKETGKIEELLELPGF